MLPKIQKFIFKKGDNSQPHPSMPPQIFLLGGRVAQQLQKAITKLHGGGESFMPGFPLRQQSTGLTYTNAAAKAVWATSSTCVTLGKIFC